MIDQESERYIDKIINRALPYTVNILDANILIDSANVYPPGKCSQMFAKYLIENPKIAQCHAIADIGAGCSTLGIILAKKGVKKIIGVDISKDSVECSKKNILRNSVVEQVEILEGNALDPLLPQYKGFFDMVLSGAPWSTMDECTFSSISNKKKGIYRAFYDVDDLLINSVMKHGFDLLRPDKQDIFITASLRVMERVKRLTTYNSIKYRIVHSEDIHNDGNTHYVLMLNKI